MGNGVSGVGGVAPQRRVDVYVNSSDSTGVNVKKIQPLDFAGRTAQVDTLENGQFNVKFDSIPGATVERMTAPNTQIFASINETEETQDTEETQGADETQDPDEAQENPEQVPAAESQTKEYEVQPGDCPWNIAKAHLKEQTGKNPTNAEILDMTHKIMDMNNLSYMPDQYHCLIRPGQKLNLPLITAPYEPNMQNVETNENGQVTKVELLDDDGNVKETRTYEYDANGFLSKEVHVDKDNKEIFHNEYVHDENGNTTKTTIYENGQVKSEDEYQYANGKLAKHIEKDGNDVKVTEFEYDADGNLTKKVVKNGEEENAQIIEQIETTTAPADEDGNIVKTETKTVNGETKIKEIKTDANGREIEVIELDSAQNVISKVETEYTNDGKVKKQTAKDGNDAVTEVIENEFDENGNQTQSVTKNGQNVVTSQTDFTNGKIKTEQKYNSAGALVEKVEHEYDSDGNEIKVTTKDAQGNETNTVEKEFNEQGNVTKETSGPNGDKKTVEYQYESGKLVQTTQKDNDGNIVKTQEKVTDSKGNVVTITRNAAGHIIDVEIIDPELQTPEAQAVEPAQGEEVEEAAEPVAEEEVEEVDVPDEQPQDTVPKAAPQDTVPKAAPQDTVPADSLRKKAA